MDTRRRRSSQSSIERQGTNGMNTSDALVERFNQALVRTMQNLGPHLVSRMQLGLTPSQVFMLHFIHQEHQCILSALAEKMDVSASSITVMLDRLENNGFVERARDKADRRVVLAKLTPKGEETLNQVVTLRKRVMLACFERIDNKELNTLVNTLEKISKAADSLDIDEIIGAGAEKGVEEHDGTA